MKTAMKFLALGAALSFSGAALSFSGAAQANISVSPAALAAQAAAVRNAVEMETAGGLQHIGIPTRDMAATAKFYESLGFKLVSGAQNGASAVRFFRLNGLTLEVWESDAAATGAAGAINHMALDTKDADALYPILKNAGYSMIDKKVMFLPFWEKGIKYFNILGPNGEIVEFCERVK